MMKKLLLALALLGGASTATFAEGNEMTITQDFNDTSLFDYYTLKPSMLPEGWYMTTYDTGSVVTPYDSQETNKVYYNQTGGVDKTMCLQFTASNKDDGALYTETTVLTLAKGSANATISVDLYTTAFAAVNCYVYKMTKNEDGTFSKDELFTTLTQPTRNTWSTFEFDGPTEDCYIGFTGLNFYLDNYVNTYEAAPEVYSVSGTVTDENSAALQGATVSFPGYDAVTTDENGQFSLTDVAADTYTVTVSASGYKSINQSVEVNADLTDLAFQLEPQVSTLTAEVAISQGSEYIPFPNAAVTLYGVDEDGERTEAIQSVTTDDEGMFTVSVSGLLDPNGYRLTVSAPYYETKDVKVNVDGWTTPAFKQGEDVNYGPLSALWMEARKLTYKATVTDTDNNPMINGTVTIWPKDDAESVLTATDNGDGTYTVSNLNAVEIGEATYVASAVVDGYKEQTKEFSFAGNDVEETFALVAWLPTKFTGVISDEEGNPVEGAEVALIDPATEETVARNVTIADGVYTINIPGVPAESYTLKVSAQYYEGTEKTVTSPEREATLETDVTIGKVMYTFNGKVTDAEGNALEGATVTFGDVELTADQDVYSHSVWSKDADGTTYTVTAVAAGYESQAHSFSFTESVYDYTFALVPEVYTYTATVKGVNDVLLTEAQVVVTADGEAIEVTNNNDGTYSFSIEAPETFGVTYTVEVSAEDYFSTTDTFTFEDGSVEQEFTLTYDDSVRSIVMGENGVSTAGGKLYIKGDACIYAIDGRLVKAVSNAETEQVELPAGLYIVAGQKVLVK